MKLYIILLPMSLEGVPLGAGGLGNDVTKALFNLLSRRRILIRINLVKFKQKYIIELE